MNSTVNTTTEQEKDYQFKWLINASEIGPGKTAIIGNNRIAFFAIHHTAIVVISVSLFASIIVIQKIHTKWKNAPSKLDFPTRFPLYLAIADLLWGLSHFVDHLYLVTVQTYPTLTAVQEILSMNLWFFFGYQQLMHASVAGYTYLRVVHHKRLNLGKWEWKLHFLWWGFLLVTLVIFFYLDSFGNTGYWMVYNPTTVNGIVLGVVIALTSTANAVCTTLGYYSIRCTVENTKKNLQIYKENSSVPTPTSVKDGGGAKYQTFPEVASKHARRQQSVASQCLTTYVWVAACLYFPLAISMWANVLFSIFLGVVEPMSCFLMVIIANVSGSVNAYAFFHNEQLKKDKDQEKHSKSKIPSSDISYDSHSSST